MSGLPGERAGVVAGRVDGSGCGGGEPVEPVFVLCMGRSGSTLLRFLLDAHPELACPPETSLPALCGQLAVVWSLIEGAPLSANRGDAPPRVPEAAVAGIRRMLDEMTGSYLVRRGRKRFCDKSLGSARFAELLVQIFPAARFVCLYRHPMDVIRSGLDACPWGLNGYGFDPYIGSSPGNAVLALARYWLDNAAAIAEVEDKHPQRCHRVRYEDLVDDPEKVAQEIYGFVGVAPAPGVARACFSADRERFGPGDHKIWATSGIGTGSVGGGESVPAGLIPEPVVSGINELLGKLGYRAVDEGWGSPGVPSDPRLPGTPGSPEPAAADGSDPGTGAAAAEPAEPGTVEQRLRAGVDRVDGSFARRWDAAAAEKFVAVSRTTQGGGNETWWLVDLAARAVTRDAADTGGARWNIVGSPLAWEAVLSGRLNLHAALRRCDLRFCSEGEDGNDPFATDTRIAMLCDLLGLSTWLSPKPAHDRGGAAHTAAGS
jgi:sulfotransferase family protein